MKQSVLFNTFKSRMAQEYPSVRKFREYLRIKTVHPDPDYDSAFEFLRGEADDIGLEFRILNSGYEDKPVAIMTWKGTKPDMKSILLSSHIDVVPVFEKHWKYDPFSAHKDEEGNIFARGSQDMKCVTMWYLEAIRRLKSEGKSFPRTIHLLFTTDEETSLCPSRYFSESAAFQDLNAGFGLDEGMAVPDEKIKVFYGEKTCVCVEVTCKGPPGHGSQFIENTAAPKMSYMIAKFHELRTEQEKKYKENPEKGLASLITVNWTMFQGGVQLNVIPDQLTAMFDVRVPPTQDIVAFQNRVNQWAREAGPDVTVDLNLDVVSSEMVQLDSSNKFWTAFKEAFESLNIEIQTEISPGATDSRGYRKVGVDVLGFSPLTNTPLRAHDHNEYLNENVFLRGIDIYHGVIAALASVED